MHDNGREEQPALPLAPAERLLSKGMTDSPVRGQPLSERARQRQRSLEAHFQGSVLPRYIERLRDIEDELKRHEHRLARRYKSLARECGDDLAAFAARWRAIAASWPLGDVNELIEQHNQWYPMEARLPMDPRTGDYVRMRGRSYRREPVGPDWILSRFPPPTAS